MLPLNTEALALALVKPDLFSRHIVGLPLYDYQVAAATAVLDSVLNGQGHEFLLVFPRQSGKNETLAQVLVMLLNLYQRAGGQIVYGAIGDGIGRGVRRLEDRLHNVLNRSSWGKSTSPLRRTLGRAAVAFLSTHPQAFSRGETAHLLLVIDELQDQQQTHIEQVFEPMRAANNATAVYAGTVRTTNDALWQKKVELEQLQAADGVRRVFWVGPDEVTAENPSYGRFLQGKIRRWGRGHPVIAAEYFLEPMDGAAGLFPPRRLALMRGQHKQRHEPEVGKVYVVVVDVGGQDEGTTDVVHQLENPARDYTLATAFEVVQRERDERPLFRAVDVFVDQGSRHFQEVAGRSSLAERLLAWVEHWGAVAVVVDSTGVGEGLADWLTLHLPDLVWGYKFTSRSKAALGSWFLGMVETGRFKYFTSSVQFDDAWWFFTQAAACGYALPVGGRIEEQMSWGVPSTHKTNGPEGLVLTHDDRLVSAALLGYLDELVRQDEIVLATGSSIVLPPRDPLDGLGW